MRRVRVETDIAVRIESTVTRIFRCDGQAFPVQCFKVSTSVYTFSLYANHLVWYQNKISDDLVSNSYP
jgi:hypothetical protein